MKRGLFTFVCAMSPFAAHAADLADEFAFIQESVPPQPAIVGHLDLGLGYVNSGTEFGGTVEFWLFEGFGRANVDLGGGMNLEFEVGGGADLDDDRTSFGFATHMWADLGNTAIGVFGGVSFPVENTNYKLGVEGETYLGPVTLGGSFDYNWYQQSSTSEYWVARAWADLYLSQDLRLGGDFMYLEEAATFFDVYGGNVDLELRLPGTPVSGWVEGRYRRIDHLDADIWMGMAGFRVFMDPPGTTLQEHDRLVPWDNGMLDPFTFN